MPDYDDTAAGGHFVKCEECTPIERVFYTRQKWATDNGQALELWTPGGQDAHTTMRLLLAAYEAAPIKEVTHA